MFDQTIHGGKVRDSDSESSDSDSDEEGAQPVAVAPTPLPPSRPVSMPTPLHSAVPPTPTPASHAPTNGRLNIFADENNVPGSAIKPGKINVFAETPAQTPLSARPAPEGSAKRGGFGIFSDQDAGGVTETPSASRQHSNPFATPATGRPGPARQMLVSTIHEADEAEEAEVAEEEQVLPAAEEEYTQEGIGEEEEAEEDVPRRRGGRIPNFALMTPITERTCEYTSHTQFSSLSGSVLGQSTRRTSTALDQPISEQDENAPPVAEIAALHMVDEVAEEGRPDRSSSASYEPTMGYVDTTSPVQSEFDRSVSVDPPFKMPEGFTIHGATENFDRSMAITDRPETGRFSRGLSPAVLAEEADSEETGPFVTATAGLPDVDNGGLPNPCNPGDEQVVKTLLARIEPPLASLPGFVDRRSETFGKLALLQKHSKAKLRRASQTSRSSTAGGDDCLDLELAGRSFEVVDKIGEGGFGAVFLAIDLAKREEADARSDDEDEEDEEGFMLAIKVESPPSIWEAVIVDRIHTRLSPSLRAGIVRTKELYAFADESYLLLEYSSQGTLLDLVNKATQLSIAPATAGAPAAVDELLAIFFMIELLRLVESLHSSGFIHGDLKIDNCLVRLDATAPGETWSMQYSASGENGWSKKGVKLIDFGRGVDMTLFPAGEEQTFVADWPHDQRDCREMREGKAWSYQTDYAGLASVAYCLLFGKYIQTDVVGDRCKITTPLKRVS